MVICLILCLSFHQCVCVGFFQVLKFSPNHASRYLAMMPFVSLAFHLGCIPALCPVFCNNPYKDLLKNLHKEPLNHMRLQVFNTAIQTLYTRRLNFRKYS